MASDTFWLIAHNGGRYGWSPGAVRCGIVSQSNDTCTAADARFPLVWSSYCDNFSIFRALLVLDRLISMSLRIPSRGASNHVPDIRAARHCLPDEPGHDCAVHTCASTDQSLDERSRASA